jgi:hypothetical protein
VDPTFSMLAARVGDPFSVAEADIELTLDSASPAEATSEAGAGSLLFRGPAQSPLPQGTHGVRHAELGDFALFIVPVGMDADGYTYEAVFG